MTEYDFQFDVADDGVAVSKCTDSVHLCYSPLFWEPYIASLYDLLRTDGVCGVP